MTDDPGGQQPSHSAPLPARSAAEVQLYLDLHPCECGTARTRDGQELREGGDGALTSTHTGTCHGCGQPWSIAFSVPASPPPVGSIGGPGPSKIIDPGQWLWLAEQDAGVPAGGGPLSVDDRARLARAAAATEEVIKFIPPGRDRVPQTAFTSELGRAMRAAFPGNFARAHLRSQAQLYRVGARRTSERPQRQRTIR